MAVAPNGLDTSLGGRGVLLRWWSVLKEGLRGVAVPNGPGTTASGDGSSCPSGGRCPRSASGGAIAPNGLDTSLGTRGFLPRRWSVLKEGMHGQQLPTARAHQPGGRRSPAQAVVGAQGGHGGDNSSQRPGHTSVGGRGVLPRRWSVLKEGWRGGSSSQRPGLTSLGGRGFPPRRWLLLTEGLWVAVAPNGLDTSLGGRGVLPKRWLVLIEGLRGLVVPNGPGTTASGDGSSCPSGGQCPRSASGGQ